MRIGIDARFAGIHERGIGRYVYELVESLISQSTHERHELVLFVTEKNAYLWSDVKSVKKVIVNIGWYSLAEQLFYPFVLYKENIDLMHFPHYNVPIFYRKKYIVTIHDLLLNRYPTSNASTRNELIFKVKYLAYKTVLNNALNQAAHVIAVSSFTKDEILDLYPGCDTHISTILEGVSDLGSLEYTNRINAITKPFIITVGSAYPHKNIEQSIELVLPYLRKRGITYLLVGREDYFVKRLKRWVENKHFDDVVSFFGEATDGELASLYTKSKFLLFLSNYEGFGLPALEAMKYGCPVIASGKGSLPEIIGDAGIVLKKITKEDLEEKVEYLLKNEKGRHNYIVKGKRRAGEFSWKKMAKETEILYNMFTK